MAEIALTPCPVDHGQIWWLQVGSFGIARMFPDFCCCYASVSCSLGMYTFTHDSTTWSTSSKRWTATLFGKSFRQSADELFLGELPAAKAVVQLASFKPTAYSSWDSKWSRPCALYQWHCIPWATCLQLDVWVLVSNAHWLWLLAKKLSCEKSNLLSSSFCSSIPF